MNRFSIRFFKIICFQKELGVRRVPLLGNNDCFFCTNNAYPAIFQNVHSAHEFGPNFVVCLLLFRSETVQELLGYIADPKRCLNRDLSNLEEFEIPNVVEMFSGGRAVFPGDDNTQNLHRMSKFCYYFCCLISQSLVVL